MKLLVVTPQQYKVGYKEKIGMFITEHKFKLIKKLDDGNYLVVDPRVIIG